MKKFILVVRKFSVFGDEKDHYRHNFYYVVECEDVLHIVGELYYTSLEKIDRIDILNYREDFFKDYKIDSQDIIYYKQKYPFGCN